MRKKAPTMSSIMHVNRNKQTDRLYKPLRNAIIKVSKSKDNRKGKNDNVNSPNVKESALSKRIHELNPKQAQDLGKNIKIPQYRKLVPVKDSEKLNNLKSHSYKAVDVNIKEYDPISADQVRTRLASLNTQEVEQMYKIDSVATSFNHSQLQVKDDEARVTELKPSFNEHYQLNTKTTQRNFKKKISTENDTIINTLREGDKNYCRKNVLDDQTSTDTRFIRAKSIKSEYKYNLFSAIDEGVNTKCQKCWARNEIIATKPKKQPWS